MSKLGGYREGSGRSKSGYYNGIYCGSTYELCWVIYALDTQVKFDRFKGRVIFPILSMSGRVLGFGGRILSTEKKAAKY